MDAFPSLPSWLTSFSTLSTVLLLLPTTFAILFVYLDHKRIITSPFRKPISVPVPPKAQCAHCSTSKPIEQLKSCSRCRSQTAISIYFCNETCQRANWNVHKLTCGTWSDPQTIQEDVPDGLTREEVEQKLGRWCEYHRHLLIFATIQALDLIRHPQNSLNTLFLISINHQLPKTTGSEQPVHQTFSLDRHSVFSLKAFSQANPGMSPALKEMENIRVKIQEKGGLGVAMMLVRCGPVVQVIPVGLPSQSDLESVKREKDWKVKFEDTIKAGIQLKPPTRPSSITSK